jgi:hypothetical protein
MARSPWPSLLLLFSLLLFSSLSYAKASDDDETVDPVCQGVGPVEEGCPLQGNGDFYGMGVRVGICRSLSLRPRRIC